jgi:hypothetical protein
MTDQTEAMDRLIEQDADLIDTPAMTDVEKKRLCGVCYGECFLGQRTHSDCEELRKDHQ